MPMSEYLIGPRRKEGAHRRHQKLVSKVHLLKARCIKRKAHQKGNAPKGNCTKSMEVLLTMPKVHYIDLLRQLRAFGGWSNWQSIEAIFKSTKHQLDVEFVQNKSSAMCSTCCMQLA
eukprot:1158653-Pelagomonas_calceolata.AAC.1